MEWIKELNTFPIPTSAPAKAIVATSAPLILHLLTSRVQNSRDAIFSLTIVGNFK